ncbi:EamA family transporter [Paraglaciecola marina]|uniref:EamA family transporter n=1 Tax=Paraglaciecola marina TaxID=2500157 RepID=UPI0010606222|nr:EamA family transporter [Paraglaciecola marina]
MKKSHAVVTIGLTAIAPIVWGSTYIVTSELLPLDTPLTASTLRALPAGIALLLITKASPPKDWWGRMFILAFLNIGFFFYCLFYAATHLPGGMAALVMSIAPIIVMGLSYLLLKEKLHIQQLIASVFAMGSMLLLLFNYHVTLSVDGVVMGILGAISMSLGVVKTKQWGRPKNMTLLNFTGWQLLLGGLMLLPVALLLEDMPKQLSLNNVIGYSYLSIVGAMFAYAIWFNGIAKLPTLTVSILGFLSSLSAVLLGYLFLGETLTLTQWLGVLGLFIAIIMVTPIQPSSKQKC